MRSSLPHSHRCCLNTGARAREVSDRLTDDGALATNLSATPRQTKISAPPASTHAMPPIWRAPVSTSTGRGGNTLPARMAKLLSQLSNLGSFPGMLHLGSRLDRDFVPIETIRPLFLRINQNWHSSEGKSSAGQKRGRCSRRSLRIAQRRRGVIRRVSPSTVLATWVGKPRHANLSLSPTRLRRAPTKSWNIQRVLRLTRRSGAGCLTPWISRKNLRAFASVAGFLIEVQKRCKVAVSLPG